MKFHDLDGFKKFMAHAKLGDKLTLEILRDEKEARDLQAVVSTWDSVREYPKVVVGSHRHGRFSHPIFGRRF